MKEIEKKHYSKFILILLSIVTVSITSCDKDDDAVDIEPVAVSYVSLYHASPDAPPIDILMENRQVNFYPLQFSNYTGYLNFYAGERNMRVRPADAANVIIDTTLTLLEGEAYSLFYINPQDNLQVLLVEDEQIIPPAGNSAVRFIHLSPDAPAVDVVRIDEASTVISDSHAYLEASDFINIQSGLQSFEIRVAGSENAVLSIPDVNLLSGGVYTIVARGFNTPPPGNTNNLRAQILINN